MIARESNVCTSPKAPASRPQETRLAGLLPRAQVHPVRLHLRVARPRRRPPVVVALEPLDGLLRRVAVPDAEVIGRVPKEVPRSGVGGLDLRLQRGRGGWGRLSDRSRL